MCSLTDEDDKSIMEGVEQQVWSHTMCRKCKLIEAVILLQRKFPYCRGCFLEIVSHKFFGCLGKARVMRPNDKVLILYSGSQSSTVLLHLIKTGAENRQKKLLSQAIVLYIDDGSFIPTQNEERKRFIKEIKLAVSCLDFNVFYTSLMYSKDGIKSMNDLSWCSDEFLDVNKMYNIYNAVSSTTSKQEFLEKMRASVAGKVAKEFDCNKIFSCETSDHIAAKILSSIALGRGGQLPLDIGFKDDRFQECMFIRPLREISKKEISFYRLLHHLPIMSVPKIGTLSTKVDSVQKLTEKFVADLQVNFPSTVTTVLGTGNRLTVQKNHSPETCPLCKAHLETENGELTAVVAKETSHKISIQGPTNFESLEFPESFNSNSAGFIKELGNCGNCQNCNCLPKMTTMEEIESSFCYGCQLILNDFMDLEVIPKEVLNTAKERIRLNSMRKEIQNFLL